MISYQAVEKYFTERLPRLLPQLTVEAFQLTPNIAGQAFDFAAQVQIGGKAKRLLGGLKERGEPRFIRQAVTELKETGCADDDTYFVITAPYFSQRGLDICRRNQVGGVDLAGNVFLHFDDIYIERIAPNPTPNKRSLKTIFSPIAARIIRILLSEPDRVWRVKELQQLSEASQPQVYKVLGRLVEADYGHRNRQGFTLHQPARLLDDWADRYAFADNKCFGFRCNQPLTAKMLAAAGAKLNGRYALTLQKPEAHSIPYLYIEVDKLEAWREALNLVTEELEPNLYLVGPADAGIFYGLPRTELAPIVGPIQHYLDLYSTGHVETAKQLRQQQLSF